MAKQVINGEVIDGSVDPQELAKDVGDAGQVAAEKEKHKLRKEHLDECWRRVLGSREGRTVIWSILEKCGVYHAAHLASGLVLAHQAGRKDIGTEIMLDMLTIEPEAYILMQREASEPIRKPRKKV